MQSEKVNYSVKYASASHPVSDTNLSASVCKWLPDFLMNPKASSAPALFNLNTSSFTHHTTDKALKSTQLQSQNFVGIQEVIAIILAQEKHKVSRNEVTTRRRPQFLQLAPHRYYFSFDLWRQHRFTDACPQCPHVGRDDREVLCLHLVCRDEHTTLAQQAKVIIYCCKKSLYTGLALSST